MIGSALVPESIATIGYKHSEELYQYISAVFKQDKYPEQLYRSCEGVLNLAKKTNTDEFIKALEIAMHHSNYSYIFFKAYPSEQNGRKYQSNTRQPIAQT